MNKRRTVSLCLLFLASLLSEAGYPAVNLKESTELMQGYVQCHWDEEQELRQFHFYANLPTMYVSGDGCSPSLPPESTECELALGAIGEYFSNSGACQYWSEGSTSAAFMCKAGKSKLVTIIYQVCELMLDF